MLTAVQWRQMLGLQDFRSDHVFLREVAVKRMDEGVVQEWNLWVWAAETDRIGEIIFYTDGAAQLTKAWPRRVANAGWGVVVFGISHDGAHRRPLGAACAPCMLRVSQRPPRHLHQQPSLPQQQQSDSCSKRENSVAELRRVSWIADSTYALDVTAQRCKVNANTAMANLACGAWSAVRRLSRVETFHVRSHTGEPGNECADVLAELGRQGTRGSSSLVDKLLQCVHQRVARKPQVQELDLYSILYWSRVLDRNVGAQPVQTEEDRAESDGKVIRLKLGTANVTSLYPREEGSVGVSTRRLQLAQQFRKEGYQVFRLQETRVRSSTQFRCEGWLVWTAAAEAGRRSRSLA